MELTYRTATAGLRALFAALLMRITIVGEHHLPRSGAVVLAANHIGYLDFAFVGLLGRRRRRFVRFLGKSDVFEGPVLGWLMRRMKHVPVDREAAAGALYEAEERLRGGEAVGVFAEGTISRSFEVKPLARGAAAMAQATGAPLIPVVHFGGHRVLTVDGRRYLRFRTPVTPNSCTRHRGAGAPNRKQRRSTNGPPGSGGAHWHWPSRPSLRWWRAASRRLSRGSLPTLFFPADKASASGWRRR